MNSGELNALFDIRMFVGRTTSNNSDSDSGTVARNSSRTNKTSVWS